MRLQLTTTLIHLFRLPIKFRAYLKLKLRKTSYLNSLWTTRSVISHFGCKCCQNKKDHLIGTCSFARTILSCTLWKNLLKTKKWFLKFWSTWRNKLTKFTFLKWFTMTIEKCPSNMVNPTRGSLWILKSWWTNSKIQSKSYGWIRPSSSISSFWSSQNKWSRHTWHFTIFCFIKHAASILIKFALNLV